VAHACNPSYSGGAEIRRIAVQSQPWQIVHETLSQKNSSQKKKKRAGRVAQDGEPEFKPQYCKQTNKQINK
jgi:hypothetical protein